MFEPTWINEDKLLKCISTRHTHACGPVCVAKCFTSVCRDSCVGVKVFSAVINHSRSACACLCVCELAHAWMHVCRHLCVCVFVGCNKSPPHAKWWQLVFCVRVCADAWLRARSSYYPRPRSAIHHQTVPFALGHPIHQHTFPANAPTLMKEAGDNGWDACFCKPLLLVYYTQTSLW